MLWLHVQSRAGRMSGVVTGGMRPIQLQRAVAAARAAVVSATNANHIGMYPGSERDIHLGVPQVVPGPLGAPTILQGSPLRVCPKAPRRRP